MRKLIFILPLLAMACGHSEMDVSAEVPSKELHWNSFDRGVFDKAAGNNKLVLLDVGANWCHWCHVMEDSTYDDPEVIEFLNQHFILSKEDQDSRPDLYAAYRSHGWPATIVFNSDGEELLKLRGYQHRKKFIRQLQAVVDNPVPIKGDDQSTRRQVIGNDIDLQKQFEKYVNNLNHEIGGYKSSKMQLHKEGLEFGLLYGHKDPRLYSWTELTYLNSLKLVDPVWGGVSQYSDSWVWENPHYEKLLKIQASYISGYCRYGAVKKDTSAILMAEKIYGYCDRFLGGDPPLFWNSQNADVKNGEHSNDYYSLGEEGRLKQGIPSVDSVHYLKENAMMVSALVDLFAATKNPVYYKRALEMVRELLNNYQTPGGLFARQPGVIDIIPFEDNRCFAKALRKLGYLSGNKEFLSVEDELLKTIGEEFREEDTGLMTTAIGDLIVPPKSVTLDNLQYVIDLQYHDDGDYGKSLKPGYSLFHQLDREELTSKMWYIPFSYEATRLFYSEPYHAVWLYKDYGKELDIICKLLLSADPHVVIERIDLDEMTEEQKVLYGGAEPNTLFMCTSSFCSSPIKSLEELDEFLDFSASRL